MTSTTLDLSTLETRVYRRRFDHGLLDLLIGGAILAIGLDLYWGDSLVFVVYWVCALIIGRVRARPWLEQRTGRVRYGEERREQLARGRRAMVIGVALALVAGTLVFFLTEPGAGGGRGRMLFGIGAGAMVAGAGAALSLPRLWVWAALIPAAFGIGHLSGGRAGQPYWVMGAGVVIALIGLGLFARFLGRTRPDEDPS